VRTMACAAACAGRTKRSLWSTDSAGTATIRHSLTRLVPAKNFPDRAGLGRREGQKNHDLGHGVLALLLPPEIE
jgi:hypothetical protein